MRNFYWLVDGLLAGGSRPGGGDGRFGSFSLRPADDDAVRADVDWLVDQGIGAILTLTESPLPASVLRERGIANVHIPIEDQMAPTQSELLSALDFLDQQRVEGRAVLVHCLVGEGRTGTILAAYLIRQGATPQQALARLRELRPGAVSATPQQEALEDFARRREWII